jgi:hypothetical protein
LAQLYVSSYQQPFPSASKRQIKSSNSCPSLWSGPTTTALTFNTTLSPVKPPKNSNVCMLLIILCLEFGLAQLPHFQNCILQLFGNLILTPDLDFYLIFCLSMNGTALPNGTTLSPSHTPPKMRCLGAGAILCFEFVSAQLPILKTGHLNSAVAPLLLR